MFNGRPHRLLTALVTVLLGISLLLTGGCYGSFPLTHTVYEINGSPNNRLLETVIFWVFVIVPVYGVAMFVDAVALNLIQFWFGEEVSTVEVQRPDGATVRFEPLNQRKARLTVVKADGEARTVLFVRTSKDLCEVRSPDGKLLGMVREDGNGGFNLCDMDGETVRHVSPGAVASYLETSSSPEAAPAAVPAGL